MFNFTAVCVYSYVKFSVFLYVCNFDCVCWVCPVFYFHFLIQLVSLFLQFRYILLSLQFLCEQKLIALLHIVLHLTPFCMPVRLLLRLTSLPVSHMLPHLAFLFDDLFNCVKSFNFSWSMLCQSRLVQYEIFHRNLFCAAYIFLIYALIQNSYSEVCHPRCVFKLYGQVNSVKNTAINIWLNDGAYQQKKTTCFGLQQPSSGFDNFLAKRVLYNIPNPRGDFEMSSSFYVFLLS